MPQYFINGTLKEGEIIRISGEDFKHLLLVRRVDVGDEIELRSNDGSPAVAMVTEKSKTDLAARILQVRAGLGETEIILAMGLIKGKNFDFAIQKAVEVGVSEIIPVNCERSVVDISGKEEAKAWRWQKIAREAAKQCFAERIPNVREAVDFATLDESISCDLKMIAHPLALLSVRDAVKSTGMLKKVAVLIGPEGGFTTEEMAMAENRGWLSVKAGARVMRAETAACVIPAIIEYEISMQNKE